MNEIEALKAKVAQLEKAQADTVAAFANLSNREFALRAAVTALIYHLPKRVLVDDFTMFIDQIAESVPVELQRPAEWDKIRAAIEDDRLGEH